MIITKVRVSYTLLVQDGGEDKKVIRAAVEEVPVYARNIEVRIAAHEIERQEEGEKVK